MEIRSFLAFELPQDIKTIIKNVTRTGRDLPLGVRWTKLDNIHLTVVFMGNIPEERIKPIGKKVKKVCTGYEAFNVNIGDVGFFGSRRHPRILWLGLGGDIHRMGRFRDALQKTLKPFGIKTEKRPFKPHLTLGRFKKDARPWPHLDHMISEYADLKGPVHSLRELVLFKSDLKPEGAIYTKLDTWPLGG